MGFDILDETEGREGERHGAEREIAAVRDGLAVMYERVARLIEEQDDLSMKIPGFEWTVREMAVHTAGGTRRYAALANGEYDLSGLVINKQLLDARARSLNADNPETDPKKLAEQIRGSFQHFMVVTADTPADNVVPYYSGLEAQRGPDHICAPGRADHPRL